MDMEKGNAIAGVNIEINQTHKKEWKIILSTFSNIYNLIDIIKAEYSLAPLSSDTPQRLIGQRTFL